MIFIAQDALREGLKLTNPDAAALLRAYQYLISRIAAAVGREPGEVVLVLKLTTTKPVEFSAGEYEYRHSTGTLTVRIAQGLEAQEFVMTFCRELAEFLQRQEVGYCITHELWTRWGPELQRHLVSFFEGETQGG